jgi:hypothetical protein
MKTNHNDPNPIAFPNRKPSMRHALFAVVFTVFSSSAAFASGIVESSIQTSSRSGGSLTELTVTSGQPFYFSMTAAPSDLVTFTTSFGSSFSFTLARLAQTPAPDPKIPWVLDRTPERFSDGRIRVFCRIDVSKIPAVQSGASLKVTRGSANLDTDRVVRR